LLSSAVVRKRAWRTHHGGTCLPGWPGLGAACRCSEGLVGDRLKDLMRLWNEGINQRSAVVSVLREVRDLSLCFQAFKFSFINPKCNRVAHTLAKQVTGDAKSGSWHVSPTCIANLMIADCNPGTIWWMNLPGRKKDYYIFRLNWLHVSLLFNTLYCFY